MEILGIDVLENIGAIVRLVLADFNEIVIPSPSLVELHLGEESALGDVEKDSREDASGDKVNSVVMREIQSSPPDPDDPYDENRPGFGKDVAEEHSIHGSDGSMERREGTKNHGRCRERRCIEVDTEELVNSLQPSWRSLDVVVGRSKTILIFIPGWSIWEHELSSNTKRIHVSKSSRVHWQRSRGSKDEHNGGSDERSGEM